MTDTPRRAVPVVMPVDETPVPTVPAVPTVPVARRAADEYEDRPLRRYRRDDDSGEYEPVRRRRRVKHPSPRGFLVTLGFFVFMIATMVGYMLTVGVYLGVKHDGEVPADEVRRATVNALVVVSVMDVFIVAAAVAVAGRPTPGAAVIPPLYGWLLGPPALVGMLTLNFGFALVVRFIFNLKPADDAEGLTLAADPVLAVLLICVQPAVMEEFFFRYLLLGHFRTHVNAHAAVFLSSAFFMAAHVGQIGGWPVLFILGGVLGYARVCTGGLLLPMAMHFLHNLAVIGIGPMIEGRTAAFS